MSSDVVQVKSEQSSVGEAEDLRKELASTSVSPLTDTK